MARIWKSPETSVFLVALLLRVGWILVAGDDSLTHSDDARAYHDLAVNLVERHRYVTDVDPPFRLDAPYARRPPLTPFVLASAYSVFGPHLLVGQLLLSFLGAVSVVMVYSLGKQLFSENVGIISGLFAAVYPFFVFLAAVPLTENVALLLFTSLAYLLTKDSSAFSTKHAILTGGILGAAALDRPQVLGFFPLLVLLSLVNVKQIWRTRLRWLSIALMSSAVVLVPWIIRNYVVVGGWFPISLQGGVALYEGNNPFTQTALTGLRNGARGWYDDPRYGADLAGLSSLEGDREAFRLAVAFIREHPGQSLGYSVQKVGVFFRAYDHPIARLSWYLVFALSLVGWFWTARRWRELLPLYLLTLQTLLTAAIFTSMPRFRAPVEPFFLLMAAFVLHEAWMRRSAIHGPRDA